MVLLYSCSHHEPFKEVNAQGMTVQLMRLDDPGNESTHLSYKVKLIPDKQLLENITSTDKTAMQYRMDSCFYIREKNGSNYAALVQPVANGVAGSYEYLLEFDTEPSKKQDSVRLVYQDKYTNRNTYQITIAR